MCFVNYKSPCYCSSNVDLFACFSFAPFLFLFVFIFAVHLLDSIIADNYIINASRSPASEYGSLTTG